MPVNPADSPVMGALYGTDAMRAAMGERAFLQRMLDFEAALARAQSKLGIVPPAAASAITEAASVDKLDFAELAEATRNTGYPVVGLVKQLTAASGPDAGRWTHWGATTQDVMDTAVVLQ
ncbi:MAG: pcaB, partial [Rubritepida sp.]|nr:pcaB [Rubritepida sp.]